MTEIATDIRLLPHSVDERACSSAPFFKLWVKVPQNKNEMLTYIDTGGQQMLYDPQIYTGDYKSNLSIVTVLKMESQDVYIISNIVQPFCYLMPTGVLIYQSSEIVYNTNYMLDSSVKFHRLYDHLDTKRYAFYTLIENDPDKRAYLLPQEDNKQQGAQAKVMQVVQTADQSPKGKYVFSISESGYGPGPFNHPGH